LEHSYRNIGFLLLPIPLLMVAGFWIPYIAEFPKFDPGITIAVHIHAALESGFHLDAQSEGEQAHA
jgi:hypothetical protein